MLLGKLADFNAFLKYDLYQLWLFWFGESPWGPHAVIPQ